MKMTSYNKLHIFLLGVVYLGINIFFFHRIETIFIVIAVQWLLFLIVLSDIAENILRYCYNCKQELSIEDMKRLYPLFRNIKINLENNFEIDLSNIKVCITESNSINAFALGRNTIAVTRGALRYLSDTDLSAIIVHEFGHIYHGDTIVLLFAIFGNVFFSLSVLLIGALEKAIPSKFIRLVLVIVPSVFLYLIIFVLKFRDRNNEMLADYFAVQSGYGKDLISAFYSMLQINNSEESTMLGKLVADHPSIYYRLTVLESYEYRQEKRNLIALLKRRKKREEVYYR